MTSTQIGLTSSWFYSLQKDFPIYNNKTRGVELKVIPLALSIFARMTLVTFAAAGFYQNMRGVFFQYYSPLWYIKTTAQVMLVMSLYIAIIRSRKERYWSSESHIADLLAAPAKHSDETIIKQIEQNPTIYGAAQDPQIILTAISVKQYRPGLIDWVAANPNTNTRTHLTFDYFITLAKSAHEQWALQTATKLEEKGFRVDFMFEKYDASTLILVPTTEETSGGKCALLKRPLWHALVACWRQNSQTTTQFAQVLLKIGLQPEEMTIGGAPLHSLAIFAGEAWALTALQTLIDSGLEVSLLNSSKLSLWDSFETNWKTNAVQTRKFIQLLLNHGFRHSDNARISRRFRNEQIEKTLLAGRFKNPNSPLYKDRLPLDIFKLIFDWSKLGPKNDPPPPPPVHHLRLGPQSSPYSEDTKFILL